MPDVSLVLALHREGHYLRRTLRSLAEAAAYAYQFGISTELVSVLDRSDPLTEAALNRFDFSPFERHRVLHVDNGSLGPTRNDGCQAACGTYVLTADGDDLISFNTIERMYRAAERLGPQAILIPQFIFAFGADYHIAEYFDLGQVTPLALISANPFVSRVFLHRSVCRKLGYQDVRMTNGYAYEDWHFNCEAVAHGYSFHAVSDTILFYRQRSGGLLQQGRHISVRHIPPSTLFEPVTFRRVCAPWVEKFAAEGDHRSSLLSCGGAVLHDPVCLELLAAAHRIEPAIVLDRLQQGVCFNYLQTDFEPSLAFYRICDTVGDRRFDEVFLLPFLTTGGADRYVLDIINELTVRNPDIRILIVFGELFERYAWLERLPPNCVTIDLFAIGPKLSPEQHDLLCLKLIQATAHEARLHLRSGVFAQRFFARFAAVLSKYRPVFYRFSDGRNSYGDLVLVEPSAFTFVSEHIEHLDQVVCDSAGILADDQRRIGFMQEKWRLLYSRLDVDVPSPVAAGTQSARARSILWVSRLDPEKRPELLAEIARLLAHRMPDATLHVYGRPRLGEFDLTVLTSLPTVCYHGAFDRFEDLNAASHDCFVYTSRYDGIPIVLLEMMAAGVPIVAPNAGYISEIICDRETGLLLECSGDDSADAARYVRAIEMLFADGELRTRLIQRALALVQANFSPARFSQAVAEIFHPDPMPRALAAAQ